VNAAARHTAGQAAGEEPGNREDAAASGESRRYLRGSSLLLAGRVISVLLNFVVQVVTVRYLSKGDYGGFAYGIGVASFGTTLALLGMGRGIPRLVPIYRERQDHGRALGAVVLAAAAVLLVGGCLVAALYVFQHAFAARAGVPPASQALLLVLILLAPLDAVDNLLQHAVAVFCSPRTIFLRRHLLGPGFKLASVLVVALAGGDVFLLAAGYLVGSVVGVSVLAGVLLRAWKREGLLRYLHPGRVRLPVREVFGFSLPLISTDLSVAFRGSFMVIALEYVWSPPAVADYRAVLPVANLNTIAFESFSFLFVPLASRMFVRGEHDGIAALYWRTSLWIAVLTFPIFTVTCLMAPTLTVLFFGERYAASATLLAILAAGHYCNASFGFNSATLRVHGKVRSTVLVEVLTVAAAIVLGGVLIPKQGALGAALATSATLVLQNVFYQVSLMAGRTGIGLPPWRYGRVYLLIAALSTVLAAVGSVLHPPAYALALLAAAASLLVIRTSRHTVEPGVHFPELLRVRPLRWLLASRPSG